MFKFIKFYIFYVSTYTFRICLCFQTGAEELGGGGEIYYQDIFVWREFIILWSDCESLGGIAPTPCSLLLTETVTGHVGKTSHRLFIPRMLTTYGQKSLCYRGVVAYGIKS